MEDTFVFTVQWLIDFMLSRTGSLWYDAVNIWCIWSGRMCECSSRQFWESWRQLPMLECNGRRLPTEQFWVSYRDEQPYLSKQHLRFSMRGINWYPCKQFHITVSCPIDLLLNAPISWKFTWLYIFYWGKTSLQQYFKKKFPRFPSSLDDFSVQ